MVNTRDFSEYVYQLGIRSIHTFESMEDLNEAELRFSKSKFMSKDTVLDYSELQYERLIKDRVYKPLVE